MDTSGETVGTFECDVMGIVARVVLQAGVSSVGRDNVEPDARVDP